MIHHQQAGITNTPATLAASRKRAAALHIDQVVVATTTGQTALDCAQAMPDMKTIVAVTMHAVDRTIHVKRPSGMVLAPDPERLAAARAAGVIIYTGVHSLGGAVSNAVHQQFGGAQAVDIIAATYKTISVGTKVAVECMLMAADAGLLDMQQPVISLGGWKGGADTAVVLKPAYTHRFFDTRIIEFIALPRLDGDATATDLRPIRT